MFLPVKTTVGFETWSTVSTGISFQDLSGVDVRLTYSMVNVKSSGPSCLDSYHVPHYILASPQLCIKKNPTAVC